MVLTINDYYNIASKIKEDGESLEYEKDGEYLDIEYTFKIYGYVEDDYYHGTGAFVETSRFFDIDSAIATDEDGKRTKVKINKKLLSELVG